LSVALLHRKSPAHRKAYLGSFPQGDQETRLNRPVLRVQRSPSISLSTFVSGEFLEMSNRYCHPERSHAETLANLVQSAGFSIFYDDFYPEHLWGKDLSAFLDQIYRKKARFCVIFVSNEYKSRIWTNHEFRSAQASAVELKGEEYILPIRVDGTDLEGLPPTIGYVPIGMGIEQIADLLIKKLRI
jgi:TIR domain